MAFQNFPALIYSVQANRFLALWSGEQGEGGQVVGTGIASDGDVGGSRFVGDNATFAFLEGAVSDDGRVLAVFQEFFTDTAPDVVGQIFTLESSDCFSNDLQACVQQGRFVVEARWTIFDGTEGSARLVQDPSTDSALFYFFRRDNWELMVKVLNGCTENDRFWVFAAATTNVAYTLTVTDTVSGEVKEYVNPLGVSSAAVTDTNAFATCPS